MNGDKRKRFYIPNVAVRLIRESSIIIEEPKIIKQPSSTMPILKSLFDGLTVERFAVLLLNTKHHVLAASIISSGTVNSALISPIDVFRVALLQGGTTTSLILAHNHPSGDPQPSKEDITLTKRLDECAKMLDFQILDHIIYTSTTFVSFKEKGLI